MITPFTTSNAFPSFVTTVVLASVVPFVNVTSFKLRFKAYLLAFHSAVNVSFAALNVYVVPSKIPLNSALFVQPVNV